MDFLRKPKGVYQTRLCQDLGYVNCRFKASSAKIPEIIQHLKEKHGATISPNKNSATVTLKGLDRPIVTSATPPELYNFVWPPHLMKLSGNNETYFLLQTGTTGEFIFCWCGCISRHLYTASDYRVMYQIKSNSPNVPVREWKFKPKSIFQVEEGDYRAPCEIIPITFIWDNFRNEELETITITSKICNKKNVWAERSGGE